MLELLYKIEKIIESWHTTIMTSAATRHARSGIVARDTLHTKPESGNFATSCVGALATNFLKKGLNNEILRRLPFLRLYQRKRHLR